jgi:hypothetical protein
VPGRLDDQVAPRSIHPQEYDDHVAGTEILKARPPRAVDPDPAYAAPRPRFAQILRAIRALAPGRLRAPDEHQMRVRRHCRRIARRADFAFAGIVQGQGSSAHCLAGWTEAGNRLQGLA